MTAAGERGTAVCSRGPGGTCAARTPRALHGTPWAPCPCSCPRKRDPKGPDSAEPLPPLSLPLSATLAPSRPPGPERPPRRVYAVLRGPWRWSGRDRRAGGRRLPGSGAAAGAGTCCGSGRSVGGGARRRLLSPGTPASPSRALPHLFRPAVGCFLRPTPLPEPRRHGRVTSRPLSATSHSHTRWGRGSLEEEHPGVGDRRPSCNLLKGTRREVGEGQCAEGTLSFGEKNRRPQGGKNPQEHLTASPRQRKQRLETGVNDDRSTCAQPLHPALPRAFGKSPV